MTLKKYSLALEDDIVETVLGRLKEGEKLSPIINEFLTKWILIDESKK